MPDVCIIADDLTGAADSAAIMAEVGGDTILFTEPIIGLNGRAEDAADVISVNMSSRCIPGEKAKELHRRTGTAVKQLPTRFLIKKMDIAFRGNAAFEIEGLMDGTGKSVCFVVDSVNAMNTFTLYGRQYAMGQLLEKSRYALEDPIKAPNESYIPGIMGRDTQLKIAPIDIDTVKSGSIEQGVRNAIENGAKILVFDAVSVEDEKNIIVALAPVYKDALWAGSLGLINAVAEYAFDGKRRSAAEKTRKIKAVGFTASAYMATYNQLKQAQTHGMQMLTLDMDRIVNGESAVAYETAQEMCRRAESGSVFLNIHLSSDYAAPGRSDEILRAISECAQYVCAHTDFQRIVIVGGETAAAILRILKINRLRITEKTETGIGTGTIEDGPYAGKEISLKGGSVGSPIAISRMLCYE